MMAQWLRFFSMGMTCVFLLGCGDGTVDIAEFNPPVGHNTKAVKTHAQPAEGEGSLRANVVAHGEGTAVEGGTLDSQSGGEGFCHASGRHNAGHVRRA